MIDIYFWQLVADSLTQTSVTRVTGPDTSWSISDTMLGDAKRFHLISEG